MIFKTLVRQKSKMLMIAFTVVLGVSLSTAMMNVMLGVGDKVNRELKVYGANITVRHKDAALMSDLYGLTEGLGVNDKFLYEEDALKLKSIFWGFNILDFAPMLDGKAVMNNSVEIPLIGTWPEKHAVLSTGEELNTGLKSLRTWWEIEGEWLKENDDDFVMLGKLIASKYNLKVGDEITLNNKNFKIKGIFHDGGNSDEKILMTLPAVQNLMNLQNKISEIEVSALTTPDNDLARKAAQDPKSLSPDEYETCKRNLSSNSRSY